METGNLINIGLAFVTLVTTIMGILVTVKLKYLQANEFYEWLSATWFKLRWGIMLSSFILLAGWSIYTINQISDIVQGEPFATLALEAVKGGLSFSFAMSFIVMIINFLLLISFAREQNRTNRMFNELSKASIDLIRDINTAISTNPETIQSFQKTLKDLIRSERERDNDSLDMPTNK